MLGGRAVLEAIFTSHGVGQEKHGEGDRGLIHPEAECPQISALETEPEYLFPSWGYGH